MWCLCASWLLADRVAQADPIQVRSPDLGLIKRVQPKYPDPPEPEDVVCTAKLQIDAAGVTTDATVEGCPERFQAATIAAVRKWLWDPYLDHGVAVPVETLLAVRYTKPIDQPLFTARYVELALELGGIHAEPVGSEAPTAGLARFALLVSADALDVPALVFGFASDLRGFRTFGQHTDVLVGLGTALPEKARAALMTGFVLDEQGFGGDAIAVFGVPVQARAAWAPLHGDGLGLGVAAQGGVNVGWAAVRTPLPRIAPEVALALTFGEAEAQGVGGLRIEAGWRRVFGVDDWTLVAGYGL